MLYELRIYHVVPGKMRQLNDRFQNLTLALFKKHRIDAVGFWTQSVGPNSNALTYMVRWENDADRVAAWQALANDPEWIAGRDASEAGGQLFTHWENQLLSPTAYSAMR